MNEESPTGISLPAILMESKVAVTPCVVLPVFRDYGNRWGQSYDSQKQGKCDC